MTATVVTTSAALSKKKDVCCKFFREVSISLRRTAEWGFGRHVSLFHPVTWVVLRLVVCVFVGLSVLLCCQVPRFFAY